MRRASRPAGDITRAVGRRCGTPQQGPRERSPEITINIDGRSTTRAAAVIAATIGVGAAAFFGGQTTRMSDEARAGERHGAVSAAVEKVENDNAVEIAGIKQAARDHETKAVKKAVMRTVKQERERAEKISEQARNEGYASGNSAGYGAGHSAGVDEGIDEASDELVCSDDADADLPSCDWDW
jgi:hypothetical protein